MDRLRPEFFHMANQPPERRRIGGPAAADDVDGDARSGQRVADRSAAAQGADVHLEFVLRQSAGQQAQLLCRTAAVERVDDVEDALFQRRCLAESIPGRIGFLPNEFGEIECLPIVPFARPGVQVGTAGPCGIPPLG